MNGSLNKSKRAQAAAEVAQIKSLLTKFDPTTSTRYQRRVHMRLEHHRFSRKVILGEPLATPMYVAAWTRQSTAATSFKSQVKVRMTDLVWVGLDRTLAIVDPNDQSSRPRRILVKPNELDDHQRHELLLGLRQDFDAIDSKIQEDRHKLARSSADSMMVSRYGVGWDDDPYPSIEESDRFHMRDELEEHFIANAVVGYDAG